MYSRKSRSPWKLLLDYLSMTSFFMLGLLLDWSWHLFLCCRSSSCLWRRIILHPLHHQSRCPVKRIIQTDSCWKRILSFKILWLSLRWSSLSTLTIHLQLKPKKVRPKLQMQTYIFMSSMIQRWVQSVLNREELDVSSYSRSYPSAIHPSFILWMCSLSPCLILFLIFRQEARLLSLYE
jgi:hypothetical protein